MSNAAAEHFCIAFIGKNYSTVRSQIQWFDFGDCYPVVDNNGNLTGECLPGDTDGYGICDIDSNGLPQAHEHAVDAMIRKRFTNKHNQLQKVNQSGGCEDGRQ